MIATICLLLLSVATVYGLRLILRAPRPYLTQRQVQALEHEELSQEFIQWLRDNDILGHTNSCGYCHPDIYTRAQGKPVDVIAHRDGELIVLTIKESGQVWKRITPNHRDYQGYDEVIQSGIPQTIQVWDPPPKRQNR